MKTKIIITTMMGVGFILGHFIWPKTEVVTEVHTSTQLELTDVRSVVATCVLQQGGTFIADYDLNSKDHWVGFMSTSTKGLMFGAIHAYCSHPASQEDVTLPPTN